MDARRPSTSGSDTGSDRSGVDNTSEDFSAAATRSSAGEGAGQGASSATSEEELEDAHLSESLVALSRLPTGRMGLTDTLTRVATYAVRAIPGAEGAGLTLLEEGRSDTIVATAAFVSEIDDIQYGIGQGPCISAASEGRTVISGSLGADSRWLQFGSKAARLGVHSAVSLPLITSSGVVGAMNVYAHDKQVFDERAAELGELFAEPAAIAVQNAQILAQAKRLAHQLQIALEERGVIDRAIGILMSRTGTSHSEALQRLRQMSQSDHLKLAATATKLVDEAVRRARARHTE